MCRYCDPQLQACNKSTLYNIEIEVIIAATRSNYRREMRKIKSTILIFFSAIIELVRELLISNMHNNLKMIHEFFFKLLRPQGQIIAVKCEKSQ